MSLTNSPFFMASTGTEFYDFPIEQSLRFNRADSTYLNRTASSPTLGTKATWSFWIKKCDVVSDTNGSYRTVFYCGTPNVDGFRIGFAKYSGNNHVLHISQDNGPSAAHIFMRTEAALRDTSAWYNFVIRYDSTDATAADRIKVYINGELASIQSSPRTNPSLNLIPKWQVSGTTLKIGKGRDDDNEHYDMYLADVNFIDGQALDATSFGETKSGIWIPKDTADLTFGTNGFRLQFGDTTEASGFNTVTYTGNGTSQSVSGVGFSSSPDFVWIKERTSTSSHILVNSVIGSTKLLSSNTTDAEATDANKVASLDTDGFSIGSSGAVNQSSQTYVAWCWDAGSGSPASNTDGSITSTVKANTDYGFSITSYTGNGTAGATVGHGLGVAPDMIIVKSRDNARDWRVYHSSLGSAYTLDLNTTNAVAGPSTAYWNSTDPTSSVFSIGSVTTVNGSGEDYISYCFAEKTGYSKIGTYTGTGAAGNSITLGFKPAFLLIKETGNANSWELLDNTRNTSSPFDKRLFPNDSGVEGTTTSLSYSDTGFETLNGNTGINRSGGNYIYMAFADTRNAAFWRDTSGQGNDWQPNNLVFSDVVLDGVTNNWATNNGTMRANITQSEGNLKMVGVGGNYDNMASTFTFDVEDADGWYWEYRSIGNDNDTTIGISTPQNVEFNQSDATNPFSNTTACVSYNGVGTKKVAGTNSAYGDSWTAGDIIGVAVKAGSVYFYKNGTIQNSGTAAATGLTGDYVAAYAINGTQSGTANYGQDSTFAGLETAGGNADENGYGDFAYAPPSGYLSLCSANLPSGAINTLNDETPEDYFNTVLYSATAGVAGSVTGYGFAPDWLWTKARNTTQSHQLFDNVRGDNKIIYSNLTNAEADGGASYLTLEADGFDYGTSTFSSNTYVGWGWKANGSGVSNTDGSITSTVSVGATSQQNWFSVVSYTGTLSSTGTASVGHGLSVRPKMVIYKSRNVTGGDAGDWSIWHDDLSSDNHILRFTTAAESNKSGNGDMSSLFTTTTFGTNWTSGLNVTGNNYIAYCFANAEGLCKAGSYIGNNSTDGTFVYTGFRPAYVILKRTDSTGGWNIIDAERSPINPNDKRLEAQGSGAEGTNSAYNLDFLSNGFKLKTTNAEWNASGGSYIFLAIAEQPFAFANAR